MFFIAVIAAASVLVALTALILVLVARPIVGEWLRYSSAFKAVLAAYLIPFVASLFVSNLGLSRILASPYATTGIVLLEMLLLALGVGVFCKIPNGDRVSLGSAFVVAIVTMLMTTAMGWLAFRAGSSSFLPPTVTEAPPLDSGSQHSAVSKICLRNLSMVLSDTGNGPNVHEARAYRERIEQEAKVKEMGLDQLLKSELSKLGTQWPLGCEHLK